MWRRTSLSAIIASANCCNFIWEKTVKRTRRIQCLKCSGVTWYSSWLRRCATSRKVAGSIPDGVIGIFQWQPSVRAMTQGSNQPLTEIFLVGKGGRCVGLTNLPLSYADCLEIWEPQHTGTLRVCPGLYSDCFSLVFSAQTSASTRHITLSVHSSNFTHRKEFSETQNKWFISIPRKATLHLYALNNTKYKNS